MASSGTLTAEYPADMKIIFLFLTLIALTACGTPLVSDLSQPGSILFQDDFSDNSSNWTQGSASQGSMVIADGAYQVTVSIPNYQLPTLSGHAYRDVHITSQAARLSGPLENLYGLICRARDDRNFYFFVITSDGYYAIGKISDGQTSLLGQEMMAYNAAILQGEAVNTMEFDCLGQVLSGSVNGSLVASTQDADFGSGDAGLIAGTFDEPDVQVSFNNFSVIKP
jgi:hypothetical protein